MIWCLESMWWWSFERRTWTCRACALSATYSVCFCPSCARPRHRTVISRSLSLSSSFLLQDDVAAAISLSLSLSLPFAFLGRERGRERVEKIRRATGVGVALPAPAVTRQPRSSPFPSLSSSQELLLLRSLSLRSHFILFLLAAGFSLAPDTWRRGREKEQREKEKERRRSKTKRGRKAIRRE